MLTYFLIALFHLQDECSFVSLRDIDRTMIVFRFFLEKIDIFGPLMDKKAKEMNYTPIKVASI